VCVSGLSRRTRVRSDVSFSVSLEKKRKTIFSNFFRPLPPPTKHSSAHHSVSLSHSRLLVLSLGPSLWQVGCLNKYSSIFIKQKVLVCPHVVECVWIRSCTHLFLSVITCAAAAAVELSVFRNCGQLSLSKLSNATKRPGGFYSVCCVCVCVRLVLNFFSFPSHSYTQHRNLVWGLQFSLCLYSTFCVCTSGGATGVLCVALWWASAALPKLLILLGGNFHVTWLRC
jgi:hypothetical protein